MRYDARIGGVDIFELADTLMVNYGKYFNKDHDGKKENKIKSVSKTLTTI